MTRRALSLIPLLAAGCATEPPPGEAIRLDWEEGDEFHVAASVRIAVVGGEESPAALEDGGGPEGTSFGERWTEEAVYTYQVVEAGLVPDPADELYPYAVRANGELASLAVLRVTIDPTLNDDPELLEADPVTYLVFREDRDRLAGIITYSTVAGERVERAWSSRALGRSWGVLSQSNLANVPTYLAPFSATWKDGERRLEHGRLVTTLRAGNGVADVFYDDELDGNLVASRYVRGEPWPVSTVAENLTARLLDPGEVDEIRATLPFQYPDDPEVFDYRAALAASVDVDAALTLDADTIAAGGWEAEARDGYKPWAGSWWNLRDGELVFGYDGRDTLSDRLKDEVDPIKKKMDELSAEIRKMSDGSEKDAKIEEYRAEQTKLVEALVKFYDAVLADLDGGRLTVGDGKLRHADGWAYDLDTLSPMDKFALVEYLDGNTYPNPFYLPAWEILNSYNPGGESWWGHCNGWAGAAILTNEPRSSEKVTAGGHEITFTTADLKGLLTEAHYSTTSHFYGERYDDEKNDITDLSPRAFHNIVGFYLREQGVPFVFDTTASAPVWNFPAWKVGLSIRETGSTSGSGLTNLNTASKDALIALPGIGEKTAKRIIEYREANGPFQDKSEVKKVKGVSDSDYAKFEALVTVSEVERTFQVEADVQLTSDGVSENHVDTDANDPESIRETWGYTLVTDADGVVLRGTWDQSDRHPDFAWVPYANPHEASSGSSENPYLSYGHLLDAIGEDTERK